MNGRYLTVSFAALMIGVASCDQSIAPSVDQPTPSGTTQNSFSKHQDRDGDAVIPGQYIVSLNDNVRAAEVDDIAADLGRRHNGAVSHKYKNTIKGFSVRMSANDADRLSRDSRVRAIEPDRTIDVDPFGRTTQGKGGKGGGTTTTPTTQVVDWGVSRIGGSHDGTGGRCWIIDTGIDLVNADLNVDVNLSRNFSNATNGATDNYGHGTHVAGIVAAKNNTIGTVGVAAGATVISVRVFDANGSGTLSQCIAGIDYVTANAHAGDVANLSLGAGASQALDDAVIRLGNAGVKVSVAAGNSTVDCINTSPARVNHPNVWTVSAINEGGCIAYFSNFGLAVDYAAPGYNIASTKIGGGTILKSGTSMAAPHVAGLLVLNSLRGQGTMCNDPDGVADPLAHY